MSQSSWRPRLGDQVRVVPNHVCIAVHLFDEVFGVRGDAVETRWPVAARGRASNPRAGDRAEATAGRVGVRDHAPDHAPDHARAIAASIPRVSRSRSSAASEISRPRRPALT
ncbi:hypothetical protein [Gemmatimonas sp.]|uniref:hypothetical protein n=1 Tax=Gemmatimonas sp. TaxID=1962908 RepID=UPI003DA51CAC